MRKLLLLSPCALLLASSVCYGAQILLNPEFQDNPLGVSWSFDSNNNVYARNYSGSNFMNPGPHPNAAGNRGVQLEVQGGSKQGNVNQSVPLAAGTYKVSASALVRIYDNGPALPSQARLDIRADSTTLGTLALVPGSQTFLTHSGTSVPISDPAGWMPWTTMQTGVFLVNVKSILNIRMQFQGTSGEPGAFAQLVGDSFVLDAELIPEPASLALGCVGAIASLAAQRRRKQR